jgi:signal transduction histidine kinase
VVPPFYASWWFWTLMALCAAGTLTGAVRFVIWKRMQRALERSERRRLVEEERMRIAQDIHDDMGARLTQISLVSSLALRNTPPGSATYGELKRLDRTAREVVTALDEIVWAVNPVHDTLEGFGNYISQYVTEIVAGSPMRCRLDIPALLPARFISSRTRHHLLMALKEALANALKHSGGTEVRVQLEFAEPKLTVSVSDNGCGFDVDANAPGNGIGNMKSRLASIGGTCAIRGAPAGGTIVAFALNLPADAARP